MKKYGRVHMHRIRKRAARLFLILFFFCTSIGIQLSSIHGEDEAVPAMKEAASVIEQKDTLLSFLIKNRFPVARAAAMNNTDRAVRENWLTALFSDSFYINQYAAHTGAQAAMAENQEAAAVMGQNTEGVVLEPGDEEGTGEIDLIAGEFYYEEEKRKNGLKSGDLLKQNKNTIAELKNVKTTEFLLQNFYSVNPTTKAEPSVFQVEKLLNKDCTLAKDPEKPQILIYHTHGASEAFADSRSGKTEDSIIGVGERLAVILKNQYGYGVIHDTRPYDRIDGVIDRNKAYNEALASLEKTLKENPSIEVLIDLHRDASGSGGKRLCYIDGKPTAQVMLFNGLSRSLNGPISYLKNPKLEGNLAFSLQMKLDAMQHYPDFTTRIFLKGYRYNLHLREKSLLIELGNDKNTVEEAKNAMEPLAAVLDRVLSGEE